MSAMNDDDGSHPAVLLSNRQTIPIDDEALVELARQTLIAEGRSRVELSVSFVDEAEMADLHVRYMDEAGPRTCCRSRSTTWTNVVCACWATS